MTKSTQPHGPPPLRGLRVLELGELVAGPFIGTLLGEFGAEVIKVERPERGDILREFGPIVRGYSLYWLSNSRNKKSVALNLKTVEGRRVLTDLIDHSDVLINSFRPGTMEAWGLDEAYLTGRHPRLVIVYVSAFGRTGPYKERPGYDPVAQGYSGLSNITGSPDGPPMRAGGALPVCDFITGVAGALGAVLALYDRDTRRSGVGQVVDVALYDMAFRMIGPLLSNYDLTAEVWKRDGNHSLGGAPTGHFKTNDGKWICTSVQSNEQFERLAQLVGHPEWLEDQRFKTLKQRTQNRDAIEAVVADWISARTRDDVLRLFEASGLVSGPINTVEDLASDPHLQERGCFWDTHPSLGHFRVPSVTPILSRTPGVTDSRAPENGQHTEEVLTGLLRYTARQFGELMECGAVSQGETKRAVSL